MSDFPSASDIPQYLQAFEFSVDKELAEEIVEDFRDKDEVLEDLPPISPHEPPNREYWQPDPQKDKYGGFLQRCDVSTTNEGPLSDISVGIKDNIAVAGIPMTGGSPVLEKYIPPRDGTVVERLLDAGATISGKTNMPEFAVGGDKERLRFRDAENPRKPGHQPGGSSTGSGITVLTGDVEAALGTDTGGSIRFPAAYSGVIGIKPSRGLVSHNGFIQYAKTLDNIGVLASTTDTTARVLKAIAGSDPRDERTWGANAEDYEAAANEGYENRPNDLVIGLPSSFFDRAPEVDNVTKAALERLEDSGAELREISIPNIEYAIPAWLSIATTEFAAYLRSNMNNYWLLSHTSPELTDAIASGFDEQADEVANTIVSMCAYAEYLRTEYGERHYSRAQKARRLVAEGIDEALADIDVLATTTVPMVAPRWDEEYDESYKNVKNTAPFNISGHPAISIPAGTIESLPVGLQFIAPRFEDATAIKAAAHWEAIRGVDKFSIN